MPALFASWAPRLADAARIGPGQRVLDVACGTGVLTRELAARVGSARDVAGIDPARGMLAVARELAPGVTFHEGVAESLPFPDAHFDAVVSQFGLMFFGDRAQALREMQRVSRSGARFAIAVWEGLDRNPTHAAIVTLLEDMAGRAAADALRGPFALGDRAALATLFARAGLASAQIAAHQDTARFPSIRILVEAELRGWLPLCGVVLEEERIEAILGAAETALARCRAADGRAIFDVSALVITAHHA